MISFCKLRAPILFVFFWNYNTFVYSFYGIFETSMIFVFTLFMIFKKVSRKKKFKKLRINMVDVIY